MSPHNPIGRRVRPGDALLVIAALGLGAGRPLPAQSRVVRHFSGETGLPTPVLALAQDSTGFIWIGTRAGLFRYDGAEFLRWAPEVMPHAVGTLTVSPGGQVAAIDADGRIYELTTNGARMIPGRARRSPRWHAAAVYDSDGRLWVERDSALSWRDHHARWHQVAASSFHGDEIHSLLGRRTDGRILVSAGTSLWAAAADAAPRRLLTARYPVVDAAADGPDATVAVTIDGRLFRVDSAGSRELADDAVPRARTISIVKRRHTFWIASDRYLTAFTPDGMPEVLGPRDGTRGGGPLMVDREGSLWLGGFTALSQYPEPDTRLWSDRQGLPSAHTRFLARSGNVVWVTTWQGMGYIQRNARAWSARTVRPRAHDEFCELGHGVLLVGSSLGLERLTGSRVTSFDPSDHAESARCVPASDGGVWIASSRGLLHASGRATRLWVAPLPVVTPDRSVNTVLRDHAGTLWAAQSETICAAIEARVLVNRADWSCRPMPAGTGALTGLIETSNGTLWGSSSTAGVLCYRAGRWLAANGDSGLATRSVLGLVPSQRGGVWIVGEDILERVSANSDGCGWKVLERLSYADGIPSIGGGDLLEDPDGTIWVATASGVVRVPAHVRSATLPPPRVAVVDARVDGQPVAFDSGALVLPHNRNRLELHFAALTFRDPSKVRYQVRLSERDSWVDTHGRPTFYWVNLPAGRYHAEVRASLDGKAWSRAPAVLAFRVLPPWYGTPWALSLFVLLAIALVAAVYRARLAYLLGLERQRTRIAMDLHDELGSGLASIGILASVLATDGHDAAARTGVARQVADTAEELGSALSDIVWSLDPRSATLEELATRLAERGSRLAADDVEFDTDFPAVWPMQSLPLALRRNLLLIGLEALHNAARHAGAQNLRLALRPLENEWELTVQDDGVGCAAGGEPARPGGRGVPGMRRRAAEIGGRISWEATPGRGTTVRLRFPLRLRARGAAASHDHASARADDTE